MRFETLAVLVASLFLAPTAARAADYSKPGPETYQVYNLPAGAGGSDGGKLVVPDGPGPYPLLVASHGWSSAAAYQVGWARQFASYGFVVVVPTFPNALTPDHKKNAKIIESLVALYKDPAAGSPAEGKVDGQRVGLEGHSAGGLATTLASEVLGPQATVLFDPVDSSNLGKQSLGQVCSPVLGVFAKPSGCNNNAGWSAFKSESTGPRVLFNVVDSTHCDGESPPRSACGPFCSGAADSVRQAEYARAATAMFLAYLKDDAEAADTLTQTALESDTALANVAVIDGPICDDNPGTDSGSDSDSQTDSDTGQDTDVDAGADSGADSGPGDTDTGTAGDADADGDADTDAGDPGGGSSDSCSCNVPGTGTPARGAAVIAILFAALLAWRRATRSDMR